MSQPRRSSDPDNRPVGPAAYPRADPAEGPSKPQSETYLVLSEEERAKGFVRPVRLSYWHTTCGAVTTMNQAIAETYARSPQFYGATYCATCGKHRPVGPDGEFHWVDLDYPFVRSAQHPKVGT
jgi:hypothetical protein